MRSRCSAADAPETKTAPSGVSGNSASNSRKRSALSHCGIRSWAICSSVERDARVSLTQRCCIEFMLDPLDVSGYILRPEYELPLKGASVFDEKLSSRCTACGHYLGCIL